MTDLIDRYQDQLVDLADDTTDLVATLQNRIASGDLTVEEAVTIALAAIRAGQARAAALASLTAAATVVTVNLDDVLPDAPEAALAGTKTASRLTDLLTAEAPLETLAQTVRANIYDTAADTWTAQVRQSAPERRWKRRAEGKGCLICGYLASLPPRAMNDHMWRHTGCRCVQQVI